MSTIYCEIQNNGEVDINAFRLMGATTKDNTKIGYFGSGIKYALATALRMEIPIKIFSGEREVKTSLRTTKMRDHKFKIICINGTPTSITTQMGRDWKPWYIFREFYCNAIDEGGEGLEIAQTPMGIKDKTRIYIGLTDEIKEIFTQQDKYFSAKRLPILDIANCKIFNRVDDEMVVYRKGVRVFDKGKSIYDYDFQSLSIDESREASDFNVKWEIINFWKNHATQEMIALLVNNKDCLEFNLNWDFWGSIESNAWLEFLKDKVIIPYEHSGYFADDLSEYHVTLPHKLCIELHKVFGDKLTIRGMMNRNTKIAEVPMKERNKILLQNAIDFLKQSYYFSDIDTAFPIKTAILENNILGQFDNNIIYLSSDLFIEGKKAVVSTLVEEYIHAKTKASDRTRAMQNKLIEIVISSIEERTRVFL